MARLSAAVVAASIVLSPAAARAEPLPPAAPLSTQVQFAGQALQLGERDGRCALLRGDTLVLPLAIPAPCGFSRDGKGGARVEAFGRSRIVLVEHVRPNPDPRMAGTMGPACINESQAVRETGGAMEAGAVNVAANCGGGVQDQKMFVAGFSW
ncbi:hypothetical protein JR065_11810 [Xanthomonas sp. AmX2]|uniref:hypothetical protein n=1 Tax=Xanthomonas sp. TaxID=29446 RepID=UPI0019807F24|nr:hypothetical protein [Xanthomonas sp.]MBN6151031.1 hypothetical protein [Xanthomonas sp.]